MKKKLLFFSSITMFITGSLFLFLGATEKGGREESLVDKYYNQAFKNYSDLDDNMKELKLVKSKANEYKAKYSKIEYMSNKYFKDAYKYIDKTTDLELKKLLKSRVDKSKDLYDNKIHTYQKQFLVFDSLSADSRNLEFAIKLIVSLGEQNKINQTIENDDTDFKSISKEYDAVIEKLKGFVKNN